MTTFCVLSNTSSWALTRLKCPTYSAVFVYGVFVAFTSVGAIVHFSRGAQWNSNIQNNPRFFPQRPIANVENVSNFWSVISVFFFFYIFNHVASGSRYRQKHSIWTWSPIFFPLFVCYFSFPTDVGVVFLVLFLEKYMQDNRWKVRGVSCVVSYPGFKQHDLGATDKLPSSGRPRLFPPSRFLTNDLPLD